MVHCSADAAYIINTMNIDDHMLTESSPMPAERQKAVNSWVFHQPEYMTIDFWS